MNRKAGITGVIGAIVLLWAGNASAKFYIVQELPPPVVWQFVSTSPRSNEGLSSPPQVITVTFSQAVKPEESYIKLYDPYNNPLTTGGISAKGNSMTLKLPGFPPGYAGTYRVEWKAQCQCNDTTVLNNSFYFHID
jgi:methionine-rich copper-binding protein CopC